MGEKVGENSKKLFKSNSQSSQRHKKGLTSVSPHDSQKNELPLCIICRIKESKLDLLSNIRFSLIVK